MKKLVLLALVLFQLAMVFAQADSTYEGKAGVADVADSDPGLFMVMMFLLIGFIGALFMGLILVALVCLAFGVLSFVGLTSVATIIGIYGRSFSKGVKWFLQLCGCAAGAGFGLVSAVILHYAWLTQYSLASLAAWAIAGGALSGFLLGFLLFKVLEKLYARYFPSNKYSQQSHPGIAT